MKIRELLLGPPRNPLDPKVFERIALVALLAWVGLGADGLSSSCYGPEEVFLALGPHRSLIPFLILMVILTVSILSWGYSYTIEAFPGGGGGYVVASKTLGPYAGLLCGCALLVDYVLTIAMSLSSGVDALFSALPTGAQFLKLPATLLIATVLMILNLRGIKESILVLLPIFVGFLITHLLVITLALVAHAQDFGSTWREACTTASSLGGGMLLLVLLKAFTAGAGTYTGIEAVSNSVPILKEPRVATAQRAMLYMTVSLSFVSGGLLLGYLLYGVHPQAGRTLNAVLLGKMLEGTPWAGWFVPLTLLSEGALLFVAAQAGYVSGPRAMAAMAVDSWIPRWFRRLNDRLVTSNGVIFISLGAMLAVVLTGGRVQILVRVYAFSVFVTFVLSQLGMCLYQIRHREPGWPLRLAVNGTAMGLSLLVAGSMAVFHWHEGVWAALLALLVLMLGGLAIRHYYFRMGRLLGRLDRLIPQLESEPPRGEPPARDPAAPTAVILVRGYNGPGLHTLLAVLRLFPNYFRNLVFLSVGEIDYDRFKGAREVQQLKESVSLHLEKYVVLARRWGFHAEPRMALGVDAVEEITQICKALALEFPHAIFFAGQLIYEEPTFINRLLHDQTGEMIQRRLQFEGLALIMLPIRVLRPRRRA